MLQHLLFLRPSIEGVSITTENVIFKLVYAVSCPLFLAFGVIFYTRICFTDPINCVLNSSESFKVIKAIDSYCLENSYIHHQHQHHGLSSTLTDIDDPHILTNYQYVGLFFLLCGCLSYAPYILWEWFENGFLKSLLQDLNSITMITEEDKLSGQIGKLVSICKKNPSMLKTYAAANILCEGCNLASLLAMFALGDRFLRGYFVSLGLLWGRDEVFPKVANCSWNTVGPSGNDGGVLYEGVCTMNMNYLSEKLFFLTWWWLLGCISLSILNLTYRYVLVRSQDFRSGMITEGHFHYILQYTGDENQALVKYAPYLKKIRYEEFFILKRIQANVPLHTMGEILLELEKRAKEK